MTSGPPKLIISYCCSMEHSCLFTTKLVRL